jgi:hypothetical protein
MSGSVFSQTLRLRNEGGNCQGRETVFQWIPSHCGVPCNDMFDILAKDSLTFHFLKSRLPTNSQMHRLQERVRFWYKTSITTSERQSLGDNTGGQNTIYSFLKCLSRHFSPHHRIRLPAAEPEQAWNERFRKRDLVPEPTYVCTPQISH